MAGFQELPTVDLSSLGAPDALADLAGRFAAAFEQAGFCYLAGHGIGRDLIDGVLEANRRFHALPAARKNAVAINAWHRGYMGFASSTIVTSSVEKATRPNQSESFLIMHEVAADAPEHLAGRPLQGPNQWPADLPGFREAVTAYNDAQEALCRAMTPAITLALGLEAKSLAPFFEKPTTFLRLLHYPPQPDLDDRRAYGSAPHTDYGFITVLLQDGSGGLQVMNDADEWIDVEPRRDCFVLNLGDMAMRWSNGDWRSTRHRVINRSGGERYSAPFFYDMNMEAEVAPWPNRIAPGAAPRFEPVVYGEYLMHRIDANYDYRRVS